MTAGGRPRVLVADDESHIVDLLVAVFEEHGAEVLRAFDGAEALRIAREREPRLAVIDVMMPRMRGDEVCRRIKADPATAGMAVVLMSAIHQIDVPDAGADRFMPKPFDLEGIDELAERYLKGR